MMYFYSAYSREDHRNRTSYCIFPCRGCYIETEGRCTNLCRPAWLCVVLLSAFLSVCLSVCPFLAVAWLFVWLSVELSVAIAICLCLSVCLFGFLSVWPIACLSICPCLCLTDWTVCPTISYLSRCLSVYPLTVAWLSDWLSASVYLSPCLLVLRCYHSFRPSFYLYLSGRVVVVVAEVVIDEQPIIVQ